jgi:hypothetical protein
MHNETLIEKMMENKISISLGLIKDWNRVKEHIKSNPLFPVPTETEYGDNVVLAALIATYIAYQMSGD